MTPPILAFIIVLVAVPLTAFTLWLGRVLGWWK